MTPDDRLDRLERRVEQESHRLRMLFWFVVGSIVGTFLAGIALGQPPVEAALADRNTLPADSWPYVRYLSLWEVPADLRPQWVPVVQFVAPYTSRAVYLDAQIPLPVAATDGVPWLFRIDLRGLEWDAKDFASVAGGSPYAVSKNPLVVRADWLVWELADGTRSDAYYRLLYGQKNIPKTRDAFLKFWRVQTVPGLEFGLVEGSSQVNKAANGARWIEHFPGVGVEAWGTRDVLEIRPGFDPLDAPDGEFKHDAEEWFVLLPKVHSNGARGVMAATLLANGQGVVQQEAPVKSAGGGGGLEDYTRLADSPVIVNPGSCISCHTAGAQMPTRNAVRDAIADGLILYADYETGAYIERFHLGGVEVPLKRWQEDYAVAVQACTRSPQAPEGLSPQVAAILYREAIKDYGEALSLSRAAGEHNTDAETLSKAIGYANANGVYLGVRLSALAEGGEIERSVWEGGDYRKAGAALSVWEALK